jgi:NAD(P)-dependent dehydrogenase (short-subunit alcohol dehydrogenase family)
MSYLDQVFGLEGSTAVITGGAGVLAGHMAEALLRAGARVSLWGVHESTLREAAARIAPGAAERRQLDCVVTDTGNPESVLAALRATEASFGGIDVLINAVGGNRGKSPFVDLDIAMFEDVLRLNLLAGLVVPTKVVCKRWIERGSHGSVINLASMGSYVPLSGVWAYNAAKAGVLNLTMATAKELAPNGIRVNAIAPGFFIGKQNRALLLDEATGGLTARGQSVVSRTPMGRFGEPAELAGAVLFLASGKASGFVTGACIPVDGGFLVDCI